MQLAGIGIMRRHVLLLRTDSLSFHAAVNPLSAYQKINIIVFSYFRFIHPARLTNFYQLRNSYSNEAFEASNEAF